ncbi:MAG: hypothetical protein ACRETL_12620 [Gammaproteobacteria bacterium]
MRLEQRLGEGDLNRITANIVEAQKPPFAPTQVQFCSPGQPLNQGPPRTAHGVLPVTEARGEVGQFMAPHAAVLAADPTPGEMMAARLGRI